MQFAFGYNYLPPTMCDNRSIVNSRRQETVESHQDKDLADLEVIQEDSTNWPE
jgi:hypothetical protein